MAGLGNYTFKQLINNIKLSKLFRTSHFFKFNSTENNTNYFSKILSMNKTNFLFNTSCGFVLGFLINYDKLKSGFVNSAIYTIFKPTLCINVNDQLINSSRKNTFNFIADVAEAVVPAVVNIEASASHPIFGRTHAHISNGSGFIVKSDGLILTSAHVVANTMYVTVKLHDGRTFRGVVEDLDANTDLATVRIPAKDLPVLPLGKSSEVRLGEYVIALGNPLMLNHTITAGIVSATHRPSNELGLLNECDYIQTDAAINSGNSGGPLVNLNGEAIGINNMKVTEGISFAIPSDHATAFLKKCENKGSWFGKKTENKNKYIGISMLTLTPSLVRELQYRNYELSSITHGVLVYQVRSNYPAHQAGLKSGDIIIRVNDTDVFSVSDVYKMLAKSDILTVEIIRGKKTLSLQIRPQSM